MEGLIDGLGVWAWVPQMELSPRVALSFTDVVLRLPGDFEANLLRVVSANREVELGLPRFSLKVRARVVCLGRVRRTVCCRVAVSTGVGQPMDWVHTGCCVDQEPAVLCPPPPPPSFPER
jgi:hypothetical protein